MTFNFGLIRGQKNRSGTWIYLSKLLLSPKGSFYLSFHQIFVAWVNETANCKSVLPAMLRVLSRLIYIKKFDSVLNVRKKSFVSLKHPSDISSPIYKSLPA